jgi:hypothetical protein
VPLIGKRRNAETNSCGFESGWRGSDLRFPELCPAAKTPATLGAPPFRNLRGQARFVDRRMFGQANALDTEFLAQSTTSKAGTSTKPRSEAKSPALSSADHETLGTETLQS